MSTYTFAVTFTGGRSIEREATTATRKAARQQVWDGLTDEQRDAVESIEWIDGREAA